MRDVLQRLLICAAIGVAVIGVMLAARRLVQFCHKPSGDAVRAAIIGLHCFRRDLGRYPTSGLEMNQYLRTNQSDSPFREAWTSWYYVANLSATDPSNIPFCFSRPVGYCEGILIPREPVALTRDLSVSDFMALISNPCVFVESEFSNEAAFLECTTRVRVVDWYGNRVSVPSMRED